MSPTTPSTTPVRLFVLVSVCAGLLGIFTIAFVDGPEPSNLHRNLVAVHDSLIPVRTRVTAPWEDDRPLLEGDLSATESGVAFHTWMFRWRGRWASVHRLEGSVEPPPQSRVLDLVEPARTTFEIADLSIVTWERDGATWVIAGSDDPRSLLELSSRVLQEGIEELARGGEGRAAP
jgi:hypothetical protein